MQLEVGKYYKTRDGSKIGPMVATSLPDYCFTTDRENWYMLDGTHAFEDNTSNPQLDLIAEWTDEPAPLTAIEHLRKAAELFLAAGNDKAAFDVLGVVLDHE